MGTNRVNHVSDDLFDDGFDPAEGMDGPGLFDEPPVVQEGPGLFDAPDEDEPTPSRPAPEDSRRARRVDDAPSAPLALYRRYRPETFAEVIGQEHVTEPLQRALVNNRVNHAYLFSGPRGCGKTTSARILARCLNCEQGPTPTPCGQCQSCRELARGGTGSIDVIEIDAASHGGVEDARDLRERAFFAPVSSRYKIYIVDEAHMVTPQGFNALLKLVEEPPPHVKFIFATTEPEKVIGTIRSRTHHYPFRLVPPKTLQQYLGQLCEAEGVKVDPAVLPLVVRAGAGSVRDSLSVLDQLLGGASAEGVSYQQASALLGYTPESLLDEIVDAFAAGDGSGVFAAVDRVIENGQDPRRFAEDLLRRLRDLVVVASVPDAISQGLVDVAGDQAERLRTQVAGLGLGELTRAAEVISTGLTEMRGTTAPRLHLELMCARVLLPGADVDERGLHARLDRVERRLAMAQINADAAPAPAATPTWPATAPTQTPAVAKASAPAAAPVSSSTDAREPTPVAAPADAAAQEPEVHPSDVPAEPQPGPVAARETEADPAPSAPDGGPTTAQLRHMWPTVLEAVQRARRFTWIMLSQNAQVVDVRDGVLTLAMANEGARDAWGRGGNEDVLREALIAELGMDLRVETILDGGAPMGAPRQPPSPVARAEVSPRHAEAAQRARENVRPMRDRSAPVKPEPEPEEIGEIDDPDLDVGTEVGEELLRSALGAERIDDDQ